MKHPTQIAPTAIYNYSKKDHIDLININDRTINLDFNNTFRIFEGTLYSGF